MYVFPATSSKPIIRYPVVSIMPYKTALSVILKIGTYICDAIGLSIFIIFTPAVTACLVVKYI